MDTHPDRFPDQPEQRDRSQDLARDREIGAIGLSGPDTQYAAVSEAAGDVALALTTRESRADSTLDERTADHEDADDYSDHAGRAAVRSIPYLGDGMPRTFDFARDHYQGRADHAVDNARAAHDTVQRGRSERRAHIDNLPHEGFTTAEIDNLRNIIDASGLPVRNLARFRHEDDEKAVDANGQQTRLNVTASMGVHGPDAGTFTTHRVFDDPTKVGPEQQRAVVVHELTHSASALRPENAEIFGGEQERIEVVDLVCSVAEQSLVTGIHLNTYHEHLMSDYRIVEERYINGTASAEELEAERYRYVEETGAILTEMSFFKRAALEEVQARQHQALEDLGRIAALNPRSDLLPASVRANGGLLPDRVDLITDHRNPYHLANGGGADRIAIGMLRQTTGVQDYTDYMRHLEDFKGEQWGRKAA